MDPRIVNGIIFLDAAQRFHALLSAGEANSLTDNDRLRIVTKLLRESCENSPLFEGAEKQVMAESWSRFLNSREAPKVQAFISRIQASDMASHVLKFKEIASLNKEYAANPIGIVGAVFGPDIFSLGGQLKKIAEETGVIDYANGETLNGVLKKLAEDIRNERGLPPPKPLTPQQDDPVSGLPPARKVMAKSQPGLVI